MSKEKSNFKAILITFINIFNKEYIFTCNTQVFASVSLHLILCSLKYFQILLNYSFLWVTSPSMDEHVKNYYQKGMSLFFYTHLFIVSYPIVLLCYTLSIRDDWCR